MRFAPLLLLGLCAACSGSSSSTLPAPTFRAASDWVILEPSDWLTSTTLAVTQKDAEAVSPFTPFDSLERLPPDGVVVWATTMGRGDQGPTADFPRASWPLRLASFRIDTGWEMQPAPNIQQRLRWVRVDDWHLEVRVYFGTQHPGKTLLAKTQAQLDRLVLPSRR